MPAAEDARSSVRQLCHDSFTRGDVVGWFEKLYQLADGDASRIPWADLAPNPKLRSWLQRRPRIEPKHSAVVVGCGLGDDAEELSRAGYRVVAFDISDAAIAWCKRRFPNSRVEYRVANALRPPSDWNAAFNLVFEAYTLQVLPPKERAVAIERIAAFAAQNGTLLAMCRACNRAGDIAAGPPWPVTRAELDAFCAHGLVLRSLDDYWDQESVPVRRFFAEFVKAPHSARRAARLFRSR